MRQRSRGLPYDGSLSLLTDLYELTMAYGYWKEGIDTREAVFNVFYRQNPFAGGFAVAAGLEYVVDFVRRLQFTHDDIGYLASLTGSDGKPLFEREFLSYLSALEFSCDVEAVPEGTVVFPQEPLLRVKGPILQSQILESAVLNMINFQTLIATKAARMVLAAQGDPVIEFGLRRAHGIDGGVSVARAAYIGGCSATSNVLAGKRFGIPVRGTLAHSWVMAFDNEEQAFRSYARAMPNNAMFLVDTYDTLEGVRAAVRVAEEMRKRGHAMIGVRLDSGDLAYLSIETRKILDSHGFDKALILASNDLDEHIIESLKHQGAMVNAWGVGTKLATAHGGSALGGVYKMTALANDGGWDGKMKLSEQRLKVSNPGILTFSRYRDADGMAMADMIYDERFHPNHQVMIDPMDPSRQMELDGHHSHENMMVSVCRSGQLIYDLPPLEDIQQRTQDQLAMFHQGIKRFKNPHVYPVGLEERLFKNREELLSKTRGYQWAQGKQGV